MITHGHTCNRKQSSEYVAWVHMRERCHKKADKRYKDYGARGITVCARWLESFENFLDDVGIKPDPEHSLERIDNTKGYTPENVKWATRIEQQNNMRSNKRIVYEGWVMTQSEWARELNLSVNTLRKRLERGLPLEEVLFTPPDKRYATSEEQA